MAVNRLPTYQWLMYVEIMTAGTDAWHEHGQQLGRGAAWATRLLILGSGCAVSGPEESLSGTTPHHVQTEALHILVRLDYQIAFVETMSARV